MSRKQVRWQFAVLFAVLMGVFLFVVAQPAAAVPQRWARWKIETAFPNNQMETVLGIQVGHTTQSGQQIVDQQQSFAVPCTAVGNPVIQNNKVTLDGNDYFSCAVPSIKDNVALMTNGTLIIPDTCPAKRPYLTGTLSLDNTPINPNTDNPLFYRSDIQLNIPLNEATQQAKLVTTFAQAAATSGNFTSLPAGHSIMAVYNRTQSNIFAPAFTVNTLSLTSTPATVTGPFILSNLASTVYIGYSPTLGEFYEGTLTTLLVDPVCTGSG
jgi:hypothetical protein